LSIGRRPRLGAKVGTSHSDAAAEPAATHPMPVLPSRPKVHRRPTPTVAAALLFDPAHLDAAQSSLDAFDAATRRHGSLLRCWVDDDLPTALEHYPFDDAIDRASGSQYFYHCHRPQAGEHGHLHLFVRTDRRGHWRRRGGGLTHLIALGLDARGLPLAFFTVNRWVTGGAWFPAPRTLALIDRFAMTPRGRYALGHRWLSAFVRFYRPAIAAALAQRDRRVAQLTRRRPWEKVARDQRIEVLSTVPIDWARDLEALESRSEARPAGARRRDDKR
jgi:hypothetical protein